MCSYNNCYISWCIFSSTMLVFLQVDQKPHESCQECFLSLFLYVNKWWKIFFTTNYQGCYHLDDSLLWWKKLEADKQELVSWTVTWSVSFVLLLCCSYLPGKPMRVKMGNLWEETMWTSFCCMTLTLTWRTWTCMLGFFFFPLPVKKQNDYEGFGSGVCIYIYAILPCVKMLVGFQWIIPK